RAATDPATAEPAAGEVVAEPGETPPPATRAAEPGEPAPAATRAAEPGEDGAATAAASPPTAEEAAPAPTIIEVIVDSDPPLAEVLVAGEPVGTAPYTVKWLSTVSPPALSLRRPGYEDSEVVLTVDDAGKTYVTAMKKAKQDVAKHSGATRRAAGASKGGASKRGAGKGGQTDGAAKGGKTDAAATAAKTPGFTFERVVDDDAGAKPVPKKTEKKFDFAPVE
ncbi:MAG: hypothetical protein CSA66_05065, partial [Proteobacteria bacterium]